MSDILDAIRIGNLDLVKALLTKEIDVNAKSDTGNTLLHLAVLYDHKGIVEFLLANNAKINATDGSGMTPLRRAKLARNEEVAAILLAKGAEDNSADTPPQTTAMRVDEKADTVPQRSALRAMPSLMTGDFAEREAIVSEFLRSEVSADSRKRFWLRHEIPVKAFENALRIWTPGIALGDVILFWDITNWLSGKYGLLLTNTHVYVRYFENPGTIIDVVRLDAIWVMGSTFARSTVPFGGNDYCITVNNYRFFRPLIPSPWTNSFSERSGKMAEKVAGLLARLVKPRPPGPNLGDRIEGLTDENFFQRLGDCEATGRIPVIEFSWRGSYDRQHVLLFGCFRYARRFALGVMDTSTHNRIFEQLGINTSPLVCIFRHGRVIRVIRSASYTPPDSHRRYIDHVSVGRAMEAVIAAYANATTDSDLRVVTERLAEKVNRRRSGINLLYDIGGRAEVAIYFLLGIGVMVILTLLLHSCR